MSPLEVNIKIAEIKGLEINNNFEHASDQRNGLYIKDIKVINTPFKITGYVNWSENISDAWQLFEEMNGWAIQKFDTGHYVARFNSIFPVTTPAADTAPMAIALAWLKWKESK